MPLFFSAWRLHGRSFGLRAGLLPFLWTLGATPFLAQTLPDTARLLPSVTVQEARFEQTGYADWRADSLPLVQAISLTDRLLWESPATVRANAPGTLATLSVRGAGPSRSPVFWNGLNLQSPMNGVADLSLLPLFPGDGLQVRYGGQSAALSSGSMGGSVQVNTDAALERAGSEWQVFGSGASFGSRQAGGSAKWAGQKWAGLLRGQWHQAHNDFPFRNTAQIGQPYVRQANNFQRGSHVQQFNRFIVNEKNVLRTALWQQSAWRQIPPAMTEAATETWQADRAERAVLTWEHRPRLRVRWLTRAAALQEFIAFRYTARTDTSRSRTCLLHTERTQQMGRYWLWRAGAQAVLQYARVDGYAERGRWFSQHRAGLFGMAERVRGAGRLSLLLRQEWWAGGAAPFTGSLGGAWAIRGGRAGEMSFHLSRNFNLPTLNDRYWANLGKPDLRAESGYSGDLGWAIEHGLLRAEVTVFHLLVDDWILWQPGSDGLFRPDNLRQVWSRGSESRLHWRLPLGNGWSGRLSAQHQWVRATNTAAYGGNLEVLGRDLPYTPRHTGGLSLMARRGGWSAAYLQQFSGPRFVTADHSVRLRGFSTGQLLLQYGRQLPKCRPSGKCLLLSGSLRIENVWDAPYQIIQYRSMPGRAWVLGLALGRG
ncbi:MAG TPA: TonB-dependent receptor [Saprospiraceae bacterium]|nr:TonB-dependent receptor [Saprospiraceae bacterium]